MFLSFLDCAVNIPAISGAAMGSCPYRNRAFHAGADAMENSGKHVRSKILSERQPVLLRGAQAQCRRVFDAEGIDRKRCSVQLAKPLLNQRKDAVDIEIEMDGRILLEVRAGKFKQSGCRAEAVLLQVNKGAGKLNQPLI